MLFVKDRDFLRQMIVSLESFEEVKSSKCVSIVRAISKALYRRYATLQQARLSPKSDMINTSRARCDYRFVAADGSVSNLSLSWVTHSTL